MSESWKLVGNLCRCCHSEGSRFPSLSVSCSDWDGGLMYSDMMKICFDINLPRVQGPLGPVTYTICKQCIIKLEDATLFRKQVLKCEERFMNVYNRNVIVADLQSLVDLEVKNEVDSSTEDLTENVDGIEDDWLNNEQQDSRKSSDESENNWLSDDDVNEQNGKENSDDEELMEPVKTTVKRDTEKIDLCELDKNKSKFHLKNADYKVVNDSFICQHCSKKYNQMTTLKSHIKTKHYSMPVYICSICEKGFITSTSLVIHKLEEHKIDHRIKCNACPSLFNSRSQLKNHQNVFHMLGKVHKCDHCEYETFSQMNLIRHKTKHFTVKNFVCKFCKKAFLRKKTLILHERIHTGDRRKVCKVCSQAFVQKASLNYHMTKYHPEVDS